MSSLLMLNGIIILVANCHIISVRPFQNHSLLTSHYETIMHFLVLSVLAGLAAIVSANPMLEPRQSDCSVYGEYEEYTGPCEVTSCGASGQNCDKTGWSGCVPYPCRSICPDHLASSG